MLVLNAQSLRITSGADHQGTSSAEVMEYEGWYFAPSSSAFNDRQSAELACRRHLDAGVFTVIVKDNLQYRLWCRQG